MIKVAIVIVTCNAGKYIKPLFKSLNNLDYEEFKVFVVDNNSTDGTVAAIKRLTNKSRTFARGGVFYPTAARARCYTQSPLKLQGYSKVQDKEVKSVEHGKEMEKLRQLEINEVDFEIIENKENLGFAGGNNLGMRRALEEGYEYVVLLNQDMGVDEHWLGELVKKAESRPNIGAVQALVILAKNRNEINSTGERLNYLGIGYSGNYQLSIINYRPDNNVISYASGAAVLYKSEVLRKVGLFDESFFMYHEDSDLCWRARMMGHEIGLAPKAICYHDYQFKRKKKVLYWTEKNRLAFLLKSFEFKTLLLIAPMYVIMDIGILGYALVTGWFWEKLRAYGWFFKNLGQILEKRRKIQKMRQKSDHELKKYLVAGIEFSGFENPVLKYVANPALRVYWWVIRRFV